MAAGLVVLDVPPVLHALRRPVRPEVQLVDGVDEGRQEADPHGHFRAKHFDLMQLVPIRLPVGVLPRAVAPTNLAQHLGRAGVLKAEPRPLVTDDAADANGVVPPHLFACLGGPVVSLGAGHCQVVVVASDRKKEQFLRRERRKELIGQHHAGDFFHRPGVPLRVVGPPGERR